MGIGWSESSRHDELDRCQEHDLKRSARVECSSYNLTEVIDAVGALDDPPGQWVIGSIAETPVVQVIEFSVCVDESRNPPLEAGLVPTMSPGLLMAFADVSPPFAPASDPRILNVPFG